MVTDLGYKGTTATATSILDGTYVPPPGQDPYTTVYTIHKHIKEEY
jgi:hypothetical protein